MQTMFGSTPQSKKDKAARHFVDEGRIPWSSGYSEYKEQALLATFGDARLMERFRTGTALPAQFGERLDERIVEYPWVFSHLDTGDGLIFDAGSTFNKDFLLATPTLEKRKIIVYTLETDWIVLNSRVSYLFGDLRDILLRDETVSSIVCISTLEHVGFTYEYGTYSKRNPWPHSQPESFVGAIREFARILKPGGQLLLTVPFGRYEDHGWLQQFDRRRIDQVIEAFGGTVADQTFYAYHPDGWQMASPESCDTVAYFNIHETGGRFDADYAAAARAVACLHLRK